MARTPKAHLYVMDVPTKRALSKGLVGGGHLSRAERAGALPHAVPPVVPAACRRAESAAGAERAGDTGGRGGCRLQAAAPSKGEQSKGWGACDRQVVCVREGSPLHCNSAAQCYGVFSLSEITSGLYLVKNNNTEVCVLGLLPLSLKIPRLF